MTCSRPRAGSFRSRPGGSLQCPRTLAARFLPARFAAHFFGAAVVNALVFAAARLGGLIGARFFADAFAAGGTMTL